MPKLVYYIGICCFCFCSLKAKAQPGIKVSYVLDSTFVKKSSPSFAFKTFFNSKADLIIYLKQLLDSLNANGYISASVDSIAYEPQKATVFLYTGIKYWYKNLMLDSAAALLLQQAEFKIYNTDSLEITQAHKLQSHIKDYFDNTGYPFATISLDSILNGSNGTISAKLSINKGFATSMDSIGITNTGVVSNQFLQSFLGFKRGSPFSLKKIKSITTALQTLSFVETVSTPKIVWIGTKPVLLLDLKRRPASQVNGLLGFLPNTTAKAGKNFLITGEVHLGLVNEFNNGEEIELHWQQLQPSSPRVKLRFQKSYLFNLNSGLQLQFEMYKKDSSYTNILFHLGIQTTPTPGKEGSLFFQQNTTQLNTPNLAYLKQFHKLPLDADVSSSMLGVKYRQARLNNIQNPTAGFEWQINAALGVKNVKKNNAILEFKDPNYPEFNAIKLYDSIPLKSYIQKTQFSASRYFPIASGKRNVLKASINTGLIFTEKIFRNELFQIGGINLLRGFNEESQFASKYVVATAEYRYLVALQSYFFSFIDFGHAKNETQKPFLKYNYFSTGLGMVVASGKLGFLTLVWAVGSRSDVGFQINQSKIHMGYSSFF